MPELQCYYDIISTCLGDIGVVWQQNNKKCRYLRRIFLPQNGSDQRKKVGASFPFSLPKEWSRLRCDIENFTKGKLTDFDYVPIVDNFLSVFQKRLYLYQRTIPRGVVMSYGALGRAIGKANASRAVGHAQAVNPFPLIVPCHRIIRSNGDIGEFQSGWQAKRKLLEMENIRCVRRNNSYFIDEKHRVR